MGTTVPDGWTVRPVAQEAVKRKLVPRVGREIIRILLLDHDLKPWRERNVPRGRLNDEYITQMEDVLETFKRPYYPSEPVVCSNEQPVTLHADVRLASPARTGTGSAAG